ncbi:MAG: ribonuclease HII [Patescibacteria group bacterium]|mgnify:FL=1
MKLPTKTLERKLFKSGYNLVIGVDEVGIGCLAGPVVVCAVLFDKKFFASKHPKLAGVRDSKLLSPHQREKFYEELLKTAELKYQVTSCSPVVIDRINIYQAARRAMRKSIIALRQAQGDKNNRTIVLIDGKTTIAGLSLSQQAIVKGDRKIFSIACASILAKVTRDRLMTRLAKKYPNYGFEKHKGYGTKLHQIMLAEHGPCAIHRKSFAPIAKLI